MRTKIQQLLYWLSGSYWFLPSVMAFVAIVASQAMIRVDHTMADGWSGGMLWFDTLNQPEGARALLATVSGSMITVAGVTFSLTIVAVSYATSQFGPRLLDNFMHDRGNQVTLGTFLATFLYCLLVLRSVRSAAVDETTVGAAMFVPHLSIWVAILLTLASVGVLIYFIHHIPESIHITTVLANITRMMEGKIDQVFPDMIGERKNDPRHSVPTSRSECVLRSKNAGYLQGCDEIDLMRLAADHRLVVQLFVRPGDRILIGQVIAQVHGDPTQNETFENRETEERCVDGLIGAFAIGQQRTPTQDIFYVFNQLIEIAVRALSPSVNDPITAMQCIDQMAHGWVLLSRRELPSRYRADSDGDLRLVTPQPEWSDVIDATARPLLPYLKGDPAVHMHLRQTIDCVREISDNQAFNRELDRIRQTLEESGPSC